MFDMPNLVRDSEPTQGRAQAGTHLTIALAGNPNSGKTTIFNALTGGRQHVGNYPGVTVEKKEGTCRHGGAKLRVVDLPGTYSLTAYSAEELVARDFLIHAKPDVVIDILDAGNLERNLYLAVQIMELGAPLVLALNMSDVARQRGLVFDLELLSKLLGVPIVPTVGHKGTGKADLLNAAVELASRLERPAPRRIDYGKEIEAEIAKLEQDIQQAGVALDGVPVRWLAVKLLEGDTQVREHLASNGLIDAADKAAQHL
jgi:ferrous iron transport protein B